MCMIALITSSIIILALYKTRINQYQVRDDFQFNLEPWLTSHLNYLKMTSTRTTAIVIDILFFGLGIVVFLNHFYLII